MWQENVAVESDCPQIQILGRLFGVPEWVPVMLTVGIEKTYQKGFIYILMEFTHLYTF